jgi:Zn-dependent protease with chaperone function
MTTVALTVLAVLLAGPVPWWLARVPALRLAPWSAMVLWQSVALAAVLSGLGAGLSLAAGSDPRPSGDGVWYAAAALALALTLTVLARLLLSGHRVGTRIRVSRRRHRNLLDVLSADEVDGVRVLAADAPMAYCLPGLQRSRVVVSAGATRMLAPDELDAVLEHERAHLRARHDLVLEAFTVVHEAFPRLVSSAAALREVRLLVEVLADRAARRRTGPRPLARALVALAGSPAPEAALAAAGAGLVERMALIRDERRHRALAALVQAAAGAVLALPVVLVASLR